MTRARIWRAAARVVCAILLLATSSATALAGATGGPYPPSDLSITFDINSRKKLATGTDNWPMTWGPDGAHYTAGGDGGGFSSTRYSNVFAKITGTASSHTGKNLGHPWTGKTYGITYEGGALYSWRCGSASGNTAFDFDELWKSTNLGVSWGKASWKFVQTFYCPSFLQTGKGNAAKPFGDFVYAYAAVRRSGAGFDPNASTDVVLMRAPPSQLMSVSAWQFYGGKSSSGVPIWGSVTNRKPVLRDPAQFRLFSAHYQPGIGVLGVTNCKASRNCMAVYRAATPWGPWETVHYGAGFGASGASMLGAYFAPGWTTDSAFGMVYSGKDSYDSWNAVSGKFVRAVQ